MGYRDVWISRGLNSDLRDRTHPVFVLASRETRHSLFVEVASGPDIDPGRLDQYGRMTAVELRRVTRLSRGQTETYGVAVVGREEYRDTLRLRVDESGVKPALILCTPQGLVLDANPFVKAALTNIFRPLLAVDWATLSLSWIPFDHESCPSEVASVVVPEVVRRLLAGESRIEVNAICRQQVLWGLTTDSGQRALEATIRDVLFDAASSEMRGYFSLRDDVIEARTLEDRGSGPEHGKSPINTRTLRIASMRLARLLDRLRKEEAPGRWFSSARDQSADGDAPDSSSASTRAASGGFR